MESDTSVLGQSFELQRNWEDNVAPTGSWKKDPNGCLTAEAGDVRMMVEKVGGGFRVLVTRCRGKMHSEEVLASASAADAPAAMIIAERVAAEGDLRRR
jgi:hypothetical protein